MTNEKQLKELFKYIEQKWDVAVEGSHKTDIKRIFGGVLCEDVMNDTLHEVKAEPEQPNSQVILDNSFDRERFERMFRAVVVGDVYENALKATEEILNQLDAYYASQEKGGANE